MIKHEMPLILEHRHPSTQLNQTWTALKLDGAALGLGPGLFIPTPAFIFFFASAAASASCLAALSAALLFILGAILGGAAMLLGRALRADTGRAGVEWLFPLTLGLALTLPVEELGLTFEVEVEVPFPFPLGFKPPLPLVLPVGVRVPTTDEARLCMRGAEGAAGIEADETGRAT